MLTAEIKKSETLDTGRGENSVCRSEYLSIEVEIYSYLMDAGASI
jgi:hypothetical protein